MSIDTTAIAYVPPASCQIPGLGDILAAHVGRKRDGTFVEVGAYDGESFSNTSFLADLGWRGVYIEPVPAHASACRSRHHANARVSVIECAVGVSEQPVQLTLGDYLTTADPVMAQAYGEVEWSRGLKTGELLTVPQLRLETILKAENIGPGFDLLVVDVEGSEEEVFNSFDLAVWRPRMMIVEVEDTHPSFLGFPAIVERARRLRAAIGRLRYREVFQDHINTIFWDADREPART